MIGDFKFYEVGGKIRDEFLGLINKDVDYVAVPTEAVYKKICNTIRTLTYLDYLPRLRDYIFSRTNLWLKPTNEK